MKILAILKSQWNTQAQMFGIIHIGNIAKMRVCRSIENTRPLTSHFNTNQITKV